jgi:DNA-binding transcriptional MerR regulator
MSEMAIGSFSRACGLTVGALRHYDDLGLLRPIRVASRTGYRYYGSEQVVPARIIARLRSLDVPLDEIRSALADPGHDAVRARLRAHRASLEARTWQLQRTMHHLQQIIEDKEEIMSKAVSLVLDPEEERSLAKQLFNDVWTLLERPDRTPDDDDTMLHAAHASRYHWGQVGLPINLVRGEWQCSRVYAVLGGAEPAAYHGRRCLELCERHAIRGFDRGFAYEALGRAAKVAGDQAEARRLADLARKEAFDVKEDEDRKLLLDDLASL